MRTIFLSASFSLLVSLCFAQSIPVDSLYLGQTPPGNTPIIFKLSVSPGFFNAERVAISNDGKEIYYSELNGYYPITNTKTKYYSFSNGRWNGPKTLFEKFFSPSFSPDGEIMYLQNLENSAWFSVKSNGVWSMPSKFMPSQPVDYMVWKTNNGNYYFGSKKAEDGLGGLDWSKFVINGNDTIVESLGTPLNTSGDDVDFGVSRDDSLMIIAGNVLKISFHKKDGSWTNPLSLGSKINFGLGMWAPCISSDNKYLFYTTGTLADYSEVHVYWVRVDGLIDSLKKTNFIPYRKTK